MEILSSEQLQEVMSQLTGWEILDGKLEKKFTFNDFVEALTFINSIGEIAEKLQHHPDIKNSYNTVLLSLATHEAGGITQRILSLLKK